jgi:3-hydroxybutyrate dehydrogenase
MHKPLVTPDGTLRGRTALVTGGASGIGRAVAERLAGDGAHMVVLDRDELAAKQVATEVGGEHLVADLAEPASVAGLPDHVDILVNNAGLQHVAPLPELEPDTFALLQRVMVEAPFRLTRAVLPGMYARSWGRVVHVSSVHGHRASPYKAAYVTAKHALEGLSKVIALEGAGRGVTSNTVAPGYVRTPLVDGQIAAQAEAHSVSESDVVEQVLLARTPVTRLVEPAEVAAMVAFLCGPASQSVTGASFVIDGGWTAT